MSPTTQSSGWTSKKVGDLCKIKHGFAFKGEFFSDSGELAILTPGNFFEGGGFRDRGEKQKYYVGEVPEGYLLQEKDLVIAMTEQGEGLLGSPALVPSSNRYLHNQRIGLVEELDPNQVDKIFLYYLFHTKLFIQHVFATSSGAKVRHTSPSRIYEIEIAIPELRVQKEISSILSTFDNLIENYTNRIRILEEIARLIYREWFVHYRFPNHEKTKMVESGTDLGKVPEGWDISTLNNECELVMGQSPSSEHYNEIGEGLPFHQGVSDFGDRFPEDRVYCTNETRIAEAGDILFSVRAPVGRLNITKKRIVIGRGLSAIRSKNAQQEFVFQQLKEIFKNEDSIGGGTIFKAVTKKDMQDIKLLVPSEEMIGQFTEIARPIYRLLEVLDDSVIRLRRTRDLLLPKLISGQLAVL